MTTPGERLRAARIKAGYGSASAASRAFGWVKTTYADHENGHRNFKPEQAKGYATAFKVDWLWLMEGEESRAPKSLRRDARGEPTAKIASIPTKGEVAAGQWLDVDAELDIRSLEQFPIAPDADYPEAAQYGLIVRGTSMNRVAADGAVLHCLDLGMSAVEPTDNEIVIVERRRAQEGIKEVTAKRITRRGNIITLSPDSTDPKWKPIEFNAKEQPDEGEVAVVAVVLAVWQNLRKRR